MAHWSKIKTFKISAVKSKNIHHRDDKKYIAYKNVYYRK